MKRITKLSDLPDLSRSYESAGGAVWNAAQELRMALSGGSRNWFRGKGFMYFILRRDLPYVIHRTAQPGTQILVNRQYKPLGSNTEEYDDWVDYESFPNLHVRLSRNSIESVSDRICTGALFNDGNAPWLGKAEALAYLGRLRRLQELLRGDLELVSAHASACLQQ